MKVSKKADMMFKRTVQSTFKLAKMAIKAMVVTVKATSAILKERIAPIIAGGWGSALIILIVCLATVVGGILLLRTIEN